MEEISRSDSQTKTLTIIVVTLFHSLALILFFVMIVHDIKQARHLDEMAKILSQGPNEAAQVMFYNEPGNSATTPDEAHDQPGTTLSAAAATQAIIDQSTDTAPQEQTTEQEAQSDEAPAVALEAQEYAPPLPIPARDTNLFAQHPLVQKSKKKKGTGVASSGIPGNVTLGDIARGFVKSMKQEKGGTPGTTIDTEQLARQRYGTRVWNMLRNSYQATRMPTHLFSSMNTDGVLVLTIDQTGKLMNIELQHANKNHDLREIESILSKAAKTAGLFPPIPQQFNVQTMTLSFPLGIRVKEGVHEYDLGYQQ